MICYSLGGEVLTYISYFIAVGLVCAAIFVFTNKVQQLRRPKNKNKIIETDFDETPEI
jgi:hypothetical protein